MSDFKAANLIAMLSSGLFSENLQETSYNETEIRTLWRTKELNAAVIERRNGPHSEIFKQLFDEVCEYEGDPQYLVSRFVAYPKGWPKSITTTPEELDPLTPEEQLLVDAAHVHELVGDLSEGLLSCSYNEDDIRQLWNNNRLNYRAAFFKEKMPFEYERFKGQMGDYYLEDGNYQDLLTRWVGAAGGWPVNWSSAPKDLDPLIPKEKEIIGALNIKELHVRNANNAAKVYLDAAKLLKVNSIMIKSGNSDDFTKAFFKPLLIKTDESAVNCSLTVNKGEETENTYTESYHIPLNPVNVFSGISDINDLHVANTLLRIKNMNDAVTTLMQFGDLIKVRSQQAASQVIKPQFEQSSVDLLEVMESNNADGFCSLIKTIFYTANELYGKSNLLAAGVLAEDVALTIGCSSRLKQILEYQKAVFDKCEAGKGVGDKLLFSKWNIVATDDLRLNDKIMFGFEIEKAADDYLLGIGLHVHDQGELLLGADADKALPKDHRLYGSSDKAVFQNRSRFIPLLPVLGQITLTNTDKGFEAFLDRM